MRRNQEAIDARTKGRELLGRGRWHSLGGVQLFAQHLVLGLESRSAGSRGRDGLAWIASFMLRRTDSSICSLTSWSWRTS